MAFFTPHQNNYIEIWLRAKVKNKLVKEGEKYENSTNYIV
jgi:hypothetical protein